MGLFDQFPYTNIHELNLMWILEALKEIQTTTEQFVAINSLKYADPIQWNITSQYEKNTIVIDPQTGTAYISVQPVPTGVSLTNEDYWTVVFNLGSFVVRAAKNFTTRYEDATTLTATFNSIAGDWLVWGDTLYIANVNITAGDSYVEGGNIRRITVEKVKNEIVATIGDLADLSTTDKSNLVAAINEVLTTLINTSGDLADLSTTDKSNLVAAINEIVASLAAELEAREDADTALSGRIDEEITNRENADTAIGNRITDEVATLNEKIDSKIGFVDLSSYNVSGSDEIYTGSITIGSNTLYVSSSHDYKEKEGILIERAGNVPNLTPVSSFNAVYTGEPGNITHNYAICKITNKFGVTPAVTASVANCTAFSPTNYVTLTYSQDPDALAYIIYRDNALVDIISPMITTAIKDWQLGSITVPFNLPSTPPSGYIPEYLKTYVESINDDEITLHDTAKNTVNGATILHDDTDEIQKAINENQLLFIPEGHYNVSITSSYYCLSVPSNREIYGENDLSIIYSHFGFTHGAIFFNSCNVFGGTNENITLRNFKIDTNAINTNKITGATYRIPAIYMASNNPDNPNVRPQRIIVRNMIIRGVSGGVTFASIVEGLISRNNISDCIADGCGCYDNCENCIIEYNTITNTGDDSIGISNRSTNYWNYDIKCLGNRCTQTGAHGIRVEGSAVAVENNYIEYTALDGILVHKYDNALTQFVSVLANKLFRIHEYQAGVAGDQSGDFYDIALRDEDGSITYGYLSQISIVGNNLNDNKSIGIIGLSPTTPITNVQIAANPTIANGTYDITGVITPNNISSYSQKYKGTATLSATAETLGTLTVDFPKMPLIPSVTLTRRNAIPDDTFNYWVTSLTDSQLTIAYQSQNTADFTIDYVLEC